MFYSSYNTATLALLFIEEWQVVFLIPLLLYLLLWNIYEIS